ncbi:MAG: Fructose-1,6-bisphosphatase class 2 [Alphaproteobacteria bacterium MarineAlpha9_Bin4]|nr:fructose-bisphosphatase class II [Pelagibacterales bacterium]PPR26674.1 MAG: Fructose-1,6-bisphosphatase class 2 [Alphaproteobacteria bacterium MarineAlpha9_Bin4]|tara:strand:- start:202 stop:1176 length:975 start_codon:yes stop_codon:yes gene_type:complete
MKRNFEIYERNLALEAVRVTEAAALSASMWIGLGDEKAADAAAVKAMRNSLNQLDIIGEVVIGEGERDKAPMLYIGEKVGSKLGGPEIDIALDPLEGTTICATGGQNALTVIAFAKKGCFLNAPDVYMEKIAIGGNLPSDLVSLDEKPIVNLKNLAKAKKKDIRELVVCILNRERHYELIKNCRDAGARIMLISDGDVSGVIATSEEESGVDIYMGTGGSPEGVLAAAALRCIGGQMQTRMTFRNEEEISRARKVGVKNLDKIYNLNELAAGDVMFAATGVTDGNMLRGVKNKERLAYTESIVMRSSTQTVRKIKAKHSIKNKL